MATTGTIRISIFNKIKDTIGKEIDLNIFLSQIKEGKWQDIVLPIRAQKDKEVQKRMKEALPNVTISGLFIERKDGALKQHSGYISIDLDDLNETVETVRSVLSKDPYVYCIFTSVSGTGLCVIMPIDGTKHRDAFAGIEKYLYETYQIVVDKSGKNESRARFASYDPHMYINEGAIKFKKYLPKEKPKKVAKYVYVKDDFDAIINELSLKNVCESYEDWISIGYALASHFKEQGEEYYHTLSCSASSYDSENCSKQYKNILKTLSSSKERQATISTIYHLAKIHGITTYSDNTKKILSSTTILRKSGLDQSGVISNLQKFESIPASDSQDIVRQAFEQNINHEEDESIITQVENWLKYNHELKRNEITRRIENYQRPLQQTDLNTIYLSCKKSFPDVTYDLFEKILFSDATIQYNPLLEFFDKYKDRKPVGVMDSFWNCFHCREGAQISYFGSKWLISIISAIHGEHSPLMLVLTGGQNTGKTEAFRRLLPKELRNYYAESKLDRDKDDEILMTQKLLIMDDEMGGKSKQESKRLKELTSKQTFSLRVPYGKGNEDLQRLAVLCGTSNEVNILNDPTGNRRILPFEIISINHEAYNKIDKTDLFLEAYNLFKSGFDWRLSKEDIAQLNDKTENFVDYSTEYEHIQKYLIVPDENEVCHEWSATEIKSYLERMTLQKLSLKKLGMELKELGFNQIIKRINNKACRVYRIVTHDSAVTDKQLF